jgi:DNA-binding XRE family transcriptional regulator
VYKIVGNRALKVKVPADTVAPTRRKVEPMIRGLFPKAEQKTVLGVIEKSIVFLTPENMMLVLRDTYWDKTAWDLANLYLASLRAKLLGKDAPDIVGLSESTTCYVSMTYFKEDDQFADFVVHEAAHNFHNCKRRTIGLPETRRREWLLPIEYRMRETFAYSCEAYARILERATTPTERVKQRRLSLGWSQETLAHKAGLHIKGLSRIETGNANSSVGTLDCLAEALGITIGDLFDRSPHKEGALKMEMHKLVDDAAGRTANQVTIPE